MKPITTMIMCGAVVAAFGISACSSDAPPTDDGVPEDFDVQYLESEDFTEGVAAVVPAIPFRSLGLAFEVPDSAAIDIRFEHEDGTLSEWQPLEFGWIEGGYRTAEVVLDRPATRVEIDSDLAPSFVRVEVSATEVLLGEAEEEHDHEGGEVLYAARPGMWQPPASTLARGDAQYLPYVGASGCWSGGRLRDGARDLADFLKARFPGASSYGGYNCRKIAGSNSWSVHSTGRAIDLFVPTSAGQADNDKGDPIANWLIENAQYIGISFIVWDRASWGPHRPKGNKHRYYSGAHPHHDHLHIEISELGANRGTAWFRDGKPGPGSTGGGGGGGGGVSGGCTTRPAADCGLRGWFTGTLARGASVKSCDERFTLAMQGDGNLVLYQKNVGPLWHTGTNGTAADRMVMQEDGNMVVYAGSTPLWYSGTHGNPGAVMILQNSGALGVHGSGLRTLWSAGTTARATPACAGQWLSSGQQLTANQSRWSCDGRYQLVMQGDGNLVLYMKRVGAVWSTGTNGKGANRAVMQADGNLVLYTAGGTPVWYSGTHGNPGTRLAVQSDGNLVLYGSGRALWASNTMECR